MEDKNTKKVSSILKGSKKIKKVPPQKQNKTEEIDDIFSTIKNKPKNKPEEAEENLNSSSREDVQKKKKKVVKEKKKFTEEGYKVYSLEELKVGKALKVEEITPDLDSVNIVGQVCELQSLEALDPTGSRIFVCTFVLADETGSIKTRLHKIDDLKKLKNGDLVAIKNGRVDIVSHKLLLTNDVWSKVSILTDKTIDNVNKTINISGIQYSLKPSEPVVESSEE